MKLCREHVEVLAVAAAITAPMASCAGAPGPTVREPTGQGTTMLVPVRISLTGPSASAIVGESTEAETANAIAQELRAAGYAVVLSAHSPYDLAIQIQFTDVDSPSAAQYTARARWSVVRGDKEVAKGDSRCDISARARVRSLIPSYLAVCAVDGVTRSQDLRVAVEEARVSKRESQAIAASSAPTQPQAAQNAFMMGAAQRDSFALIVGIERYRDVARADGARADAEEMAAVARRTVGIPADQIRTALDDRATRSDLEKNLDWLVENARANGSVVFFFSGHGAPDASLGRPYLLPYDGDAKRLDRTALKLESVLESLSKAKAKNVVVILDSCFSGSGGRSVLPAWARPLVRVKEVTPRGSLAVLSAASGAEISGPTSAGNRGLFTTLVVEGLGRAKADGNGDGQITLQELFDWVQPRVSREAKKSDRDQTPSLRVGGGPSPRDVVLAFGVGAE